MNISIEHIIGFLENLCCDIKHANSCNQNISSYANDSRKCKKGSLFFAFEGKRVKGSSFLSQIATVGAVAAIVSSNYKGPSFGLTLIYVVDVMKALHKVAKEIQKGRKTKIIGITGSVGKTTTKEYLATLLSYKYRVGKTLANQNTQFQIPIALLNAKGDEDFFVVEMGMRRKGDIAELVDFMPPDYAIITPIGLAHVENFSSLEEIAKNKADIIAMKTKHIIAHKTFMQLVITDRILECYPTQVLQEELCNNDLPLHLRENLEAAIKLALHLGISKHQVKESIENLDQVEHRFVRSLIGTNLVIDDAYNANPLSMQKGIEAIHLMKTKRKKVAIIGSMKELGVFSNAAHRKVRNHVNTVFDQGFFVGSEWGRDRISYDTLVMMIEEKPFSEALIFIKGSHIHALWNLLEIL